MSARRRVLLLRGTAGAVLVASLGMFVSAQDIYGRQCGDTCYPRGTEGVPWYRVKDAWQWDAQFALALGALLAAMVAAYCLVRVGVRAAAVPLVIAVAFDAAFVIWVLPT